MSFVCHFVALGNCHIFVIFLHAVVLLLQTPQSEAQHFVVRETSGCHVENCHQRDYRVFLGLYRDSLMEKKMETTVLGLGALLHSGCCKLDSCHCC